MGSSTTKYNCKKASLDEFEARENCQFNPIRFDKESSAIRVPILCMDDILKNSKQKRLDIIEEWALRYLRLFDI
ncbi:MAG: hypothetical protein HZA77_16065 [Candidatus Schekmanbacteria bacterium]|nr:hypothetical protein [Candidatus Schekmanbacteria bacterium]